MIVTPTTISRKDIPSLNQSPPEEIKQSSVVCANNCMDNDYFMHCHEDCRDSDVSMTEDVEDGVDEEFLNQLCQIAGSSGIDFERNHPEHSGKEESSSHFLLTIEFDFDIPMDEGSESDNAYEHVNNCNHIVGQADDQDDECYSVLHDPYVQTHLISPPTSPQSPSKALVDVPMINLIGAESRQETSMKLQAPECCVNGFVNAYLVVDPVTQTVIFPRQILTCQVGNRIESAEFGPFLLPSFEKRVVAEYTENVVSKYSHHGVVVNEHSDFECADVSNDYCV